MTRKYLIVTLVMWHFMFAVSFLTNGDFEEPLTIGWFQDISGFNTTIMRDTTYDPDPDYEAYVYKGVGDGQAKLYQTVDIPTTDLEFSVNAKVYATSSVKVYANRNSPGCWAGAAVVIAYLDESHAKLGETMICARSYACPWIDTPTRHIIAALDSLWHTYGFNINDELAYLSGINQVDVKRIQVALFGRCESG